MYNHVLIEKKWRQKWQQDNIYKFTEKKGNKKFYVLDMFPYPSGQGLHVGHPKGYTATDIISRFKKMNGYDVLHPIGWDAFGLPAEQYALDTGNHPGKFTQKNIDHFREQLQKIGFNFDYNKEVNTTDPNFYKWTQWIFVQLYKKGLASIQDIDVNWCEALGTVLANEEVLKDDKGNSVSERGSHPVVKKPMKQWVLKITEYADRLVKDLDELDWPEGLKNIQKKWIGKSEGEIITFKVDGSKETIDIFTTLPQTIYGVTYLAIAPEHKELSKYVKITPEIKKFIDTCKNKKEYERTKIEKGKQGLFTGIYVIHPLTNKKVPLYIAEYVLSHYGTGTVMGVPDGDERDYLFAQANKIDSIKILENGKLINSHELNGLKLDECFNKACKLLEEKKIAKRNVTYKIKDWLFSRQRYWGEPFPVLYDEKGNIKVIEDLPVLLPKSNDIKPSKDGTSPLSNLKDWVYLEIGGKKYKRDVNTMPQWAGSSWYYLAYILKNEDGSYCPLNSKQAYQRFEKWLPVDCYIGGQEHAVLHLLYARFWHKFLYDIKVVPTKEPFQLIINQGMILDEHSVKMSKSKGNIINPDTVINQYGADSLRMYEMFMGPLTASLPWNDNSLNGVRKWLDRVYSFVSNHKDSLLKEDPKELVCDYHLFIKNVTNNLNKMQFNMAISDMMIFINSATKVNKISKNQLENFLKVLSLFAPFVADELNEMIGNKNYLYFSKWPQYDESLLVSDNVSIPVRIDNKVRTVLETTKGLTEAQVLDLAFKDSKTSSLLSKDKIAKVIYVQDKILNIILKK